MAAIPEPIDGTAQAIYGLHAERAATEKPRGYLGWSQLGEPCDRALWYSFRQAEVEKFDGRMLRLFDTGHREEARILQELRDLGMEVWDRGADGEQFAVSSVAGHVRGHCDAVVQGLPEAPKTPHLVDVKTIKGKKFDELMKKGMRELYPKYWAQAHGYMGHLQLDRAAFIFVCKDDERIHVERFPFDRAEFERYEQRAERIVRAAEPPLRISDEPAWYGCKFCGYHRVCHGDTAPLVNCRTCAHSTPEMDGDGRWSCAKRRREIARGQGCEGHLYIPILLQRVGAPVDSDGASVTYERDGKTFVNGPRPGFSSAEIRAAADKRMLVDDEVRLVREQFKTARIAA